MTARQLRRETDKAAKRIADGIPEWWGEWVRHLQAAEFVHVNPWRTVEEAFEAGWKAGRYGSLTRPGKGDEK